MKYARNCENSHLPRSFRTWGCGYGVVSSAAVGQDCSSCREWKTIFFWVGSAGKCTSCGVLFIRITNCIVHYFCRISVTIVNIAISEWSALLESIPTDHRLIHCYQLQHFAIVHGLVITIRFGSALDQNPVLPRRFLGIIHSFKVTKKRLKCLENAFPAIKFSKFLWGRTHGLRAFGARPPAARLRRPPRGLQPSLVGKACPCPQNRFHPLRLYLFYFILLYFVLDVRRAALHAFFIASRSECPATFSFF